jgi:hypothetical protein
MKCPECGKKPLGRVQTLDENLNSQFAWFCENDHEWDHVKCLDPAELLDLVEKWDYKHSTVKYKYALIAYLKTGDPSALKKLAGVE